MELRYNITQLIKIILIIIVAIKVIIYLKKIIDEKLPNK